MNDIERCTQKVNSLCHTEELYFPSLKAHLLLTRFEGIDEKLFEVFFDYFHPFGAKYFKWTGQAFSLEGYSEKDLENDLADILAFRISRKDASPELIPLSILSTFEKFHIKCIRALEPCLVTKNESYAEIFARRILASSLYRSYMQPDENYQEAIISNMKSHIFNEGMQAVVTRGHLIALQNHHPKIIPVDKMENEKLIEQKTKIMASLRELQYLREDKQKLELLEREYYHSKQSINQIRQTIVRKQLSTPKIEPELPRWE